MNYLVRLLLAHLISDIFLNRFARRKRTGRPLQKLGVLSLHTVIVFTTTLLFFVDKMNTTILGACVAVGATHFLVDALRLLVEYRRFRGEGNTPIYTKREDMERLIYFLSNLPKSWSQTDFRTWFLMNLADQSLHLLVLVCVAYYLSWAAP